MKTIPYCLPHFTDKEIFAVNDLLKNPAKLIAECYTKQCRHFLKEYYKKEVLLTHSCTAALEMSAILLNIQPGDEVIVPSYTFVSTANAFALFGAKLVFADCQETNLNMDPLHLETLITPQTKAIVVMHYASIACDMEAILNIANTYQIPVIEDAAQCIGAKYNNKQLGTLGALGALSFHATKNLTSGLGGALIVNDDRLVARAKVIWQKGTNREAFLEGYVDKYTWHDLGSSYMMNELGAALLSSQLERLHEINEERLGIWQAYHQALQPLEIEYGFKRPTVPSSCMHNGHIYYLIAPDEELASRLRTSLSEQGISAPFHYVPLHLSPAGKRLSKTVQSLPTSESIYKRIIRLPIFEGLEKNINLVIDAVYKAIHEMQTVS